MLKDGFEENVLLRWESTNCPTDFINYFIYPNSLSFWVTFLFPRHQCHISLKLEEIREGFSSTITGEKTSVTGLVYQDGPEVVCLKGNEASRAAAF
jgi:hypothetical protein